MAIYEKDPLSTMLVEAAYRLSRGEEPATETVATVNDKALQLFQRGFSACTEAQKKSAIECFLMQWRERDPECKKLAELCYLVSTRDMENGERIFQSLSQKTAKKLSDEANSFRIRDPKTDVHRQWNARPDWQFRGAISGILDAIRGDGRPERLMPWPSRGRVLAPHFITHDHGFNPSFSEDGYYWLPKSPTSFKQILSDWLSFFCALFRSYFSYDPQVREFYQLVLAAAKAEAVYHEIVEVESAMDHFVEKTFFESVGNLCKQAGVPGCAAPRPFPVEMLQPIHFLNHGQCVVEHFNPLWMHCDLDRMSSYGFHRLRYDGASNAPHKVPHYLFAYAIAQSAGDLKRACRNLRQTLRKTVTDFKCATSFQACQETLIPQLTAFQKAWEAYVQSHELLIEVNGVVSKKDHEGSYQSIRDAFLEDPNSRTAQYLRSLS